MKTSDGVGNGLWPDTPRNIHPFELIHYDYSFFRPVLV